MVTSEAGRTGAVGRTTGSARGAAVEGAAPRPRPDYPRTRGSRPEGVEDRRGVGSRQAPDERLASSKGSTRARLHRCGVSEPMRIEHDRLQPLVGTTFAAAGCGPAE